MTIRSFKTLIISVVLMLVSSSFAQEQIPYSYTHPSSTVEYTVQHIIEIDDMPGHIFRIATIASNDEGWATLDPPIMFNGVKVISTVAHLSTDYVNFNGSLTGYMTYNMENGDKIYALLKGTAQTRFRDDGSLDISHYSGIDTFTGGTGMFEGIRGMFRHTSTTDPTRGVGPTVDRDGSYWFVGE